LAWGTATGKSEWAAAAVDSGAANVDWAWVIADARIAPAINTASVLHVIVPQPGWGGPVQIEGLP
jgi:hypothetical protein